MHLFLISRGVNHQVEVWKTFMQSQFYTWNRQNLETGKWEQVQVQGALRPIQLWEYVFPEEHLPNVVKNLGIETDGWNSTFAQKSMADILRKALGAEKIPSGLILPSEKDRFMQIQGVAIHPIGIKKDSKQAFDFGKEGKFYQEGL